MYNTVVFLLCSPHEWLFLALVYHVSGEPLEEARVLALVDGAEGGGGRPAAGVDDGAVGDAAADVAAGVGLLADLRNEENWMFLDGLLEKGIRRPNTKAFYFRFPVTLLWDLVPFLLPITFLRQITFLRGELCCFGFV